MYTIKRRPHYTDTLRVEDATGNVLDLSVDLDIDAVSGRYWKRYEMICTTSEKLKAAPNDAEKQRAFGEAFSALLELIFGEEQTSAILEFYDGNEAELLVDLMPYLTDEVYPRLKEASQARADRARANLRMAKKWRR